MDTRGQLVIGALRVSYDRGVQRNRARDLGLDAIPKLTPDGEEIRGGGSHWRAGAKEEVKARDNECRRIREAFRRTFVAAPFDGTYVLPKEGAGKAFLANLDPPPRNDMDVSVSEYVLSFTAEAPAALSDWAERIARQINDIPLGRGKQASAQGVVMLEQLACCPVIDEGTREELRALIRDARLERVNRVDFRRKLANIQVGVQGQTVEPGRVIRPTPVAPPPAPAPEPEDCPTPEPVNVASNTMQRPTDRPLPKFGDTLNMF